MEENNSNNQEEGIIINNSINSQEEKIKEGISYFKKQWLYKSIAIFVAWGCIIFVVSSAFTYYYALKRKEKKFISATYKVDDENKTTTASEEIGEISDVLSTFADIVDTQYIGEIEKDKLISETVKGFIKGIGDEYSEYMTAEEWEKYQESALGNYSGVGIAMTAGENGYILVASVIKDSPAEKAGVLQGDYIIGVNGESIKDLSTTEVVNKVRGEDGTEVTVNVVRNDSENLEFKLIRDKIRVYHVEGKMLEDDIGYVYFNTFDEGCADEFEQEMDKLVEQGAKKVILDLRYNTGGAVDQALKILDLFLDKGQVELITQSTIGPKITTSSATDKKYNLDNIIILTNKYTASSAEILTGALVDNEIAKTVGTKTYGKGVMQSVFPLKDGSILKLTTQEYNTPNGTKIHGVGISPNYEIEFDKDAEEDNQLEKAKAVLKGEE